MESETLLIDGDPLCGHAMMGLIEELFPICRSITGNGVRRTLDILQRYISLEINEVPSGTKAFDWTVPYEWNIREAYIARQDGTRIVDMSENNLHVMQYSRPIDATMSLSELRPHLYTLPDQPDWIPYRTSYYAENWGFCLSHRQMSNLRDERYRVVIDADLAPGHLTYGELLVPGQTDETVLVSCHICHPSLANDNLSAIAAATMLARHVQTLRPRYSYRFLFIPGTIGSLTWLARNEAGVGKIMHGLVLSCLGDPGCIQYKQSRRGNAEIDRVAAHVLRHDGGPHRIRPFGPYGNDERQYCSPGFNLPVGCLTRTPSGEFPECHSSADNLSFMRPESLAHSLSVLREIVATIEGNAVYRNRNPKGEPQLGARGLYAAIGGERAPKDDQMALLWVLNLADGDHPLLEIADQAGIPFAAIRRAADALIKAELLEAVSPGHLIKQQGTAMSGGLRTCLVKPSTLFRRPRLSATYIVLGLAILAVVAIRPVRDAGLRAAGWALVVDEPVAPADIIILSVDSGPAGALEAADLVKDGISKRVAVFTDPPSKDDREFIRRGLPYDDEGTRQIHRLKLLGLTDVVEVSGVSGTEDEGEVLPAWCDEHQLRSVVFVATTDHSRRLRRVLDRAMAGHATRVMVRAARYSSFDPDRWWETRHGVRIEIVELEKLLLDVVLHPLPS